MKLYTCFLGTLTLILNVFADEEDYSCKEQEPTQEDMRFLYQYNLIGSFRTYNKETNTHSTSQEGLAIKENILKKISDKGYSSTPLKKPLNLIGLQLANSKLPLALFYAAHHQLEPFDPFPESFIPVNNLISLDKNKPYVEIFKEKFMPVFSQPFCLDKCDIQQADSDNIERVLSDKSDDKSILFIGFSKDSKEEGSEITFNKEGYRKSLFWSGWTKRPDTRHNAINFCFCKTPELLANYPELEQFFDYIFIGYATIEYIPTETLIDLTKMLKPGGRIVYPDGNSDSIRSRFINKLFNEGTEYRFELYVSKEKVPDFEEIYDLTSFYPYNKLPLYLHKKLSSNKIQD